jgi:hypothetical protein
MLQTKAVQKIKTHTLCSIIFSPENCAVYEIMWKSIVQPDKPQTIMWRMRCACWIPKPNTQPQYVICIDFPLQQWLHKCVSVLRYSYITELVKFSQWCGVHSPGMTPRHWVVGSRCFETMYWSHLQWSKCQKWTLHP